MNQEGTPKPAKSGAFTPAVTVGITNNLHRRLLEHRSGNTKGGQILGDFDVLLTEAYPDHIQARQREIFLKSGKGREWLKTINAP